MEVSSRTADSRKEREGKMHEKLKEFIRKERQRDREWCEERERMMEEDRQRRATRDAEIMPKLKPAYAHNYKKWLRGYLENGGTPTHWYDYGLPDSFYVAKRNIEMTPLFGSTAINIIVPKGIDVSGNLGHCNLYFMDGFKAKGRWIPVYGNTIV